MHTISPKYTKLRHNYSCSLSRTNSAMVECSSSPPNSILMGNKGSPLPSLILARFLGLSCLHGHEFCSIWNGLPILSLQSCLATLSHQHELEVEACHYIPPVSVSHSERCDGIIQASPLPAFFQNNEYVPSYSEG